MFPTHRQERYTLYQAIMCGANSISFFGMPLILTGSGAGYGGARPGREDDAVPAKGCGCESSCWRRYRGD